MIPAATRSALAVASLALAACGSGLHTNPGGSSGSSTAATATGSSGSTSHPTSGSVGGSSSTGTTDSSSSGSGNTTAGSTQGTTGASSGTTTTTASSSSASTGTTGIQTSAEVLNLGNLNLGNNDDPYDLAIDSAGTVYAADLQANVIAQYSNGGPVIYAGTGGPVHGDGARLSAGFDQPWGMVFMGTTLYVMETGLDDGYLRTIDSAGNVGTVCGVGTTGDFTDGACSSAEFDGPAGLATDGTFIYVADQGANRIRKIDLSLGQVTTYVGSTQGDQEGQGLGAKLNSPWAVAFDSQGNMFIADFGNKKIRKVDANRNMTTFASMPIAANVSTQGRPSGVAVDAAGNVYASDIDYSEILRWSPDGTLTAQITDNALNQPAGMKFDANGLLHVADVGADAVLTVQF